MSKLFINLPVTDLNTSTAFYQTIGFIKNDNFSDEKASGMVWDDHIHVMLLSHDFMKSFLPPEKVIADAHKTTQVLNALQFDSREEVDVFVAKALAAWGKATIPPYDHGFMYGRDFEDLDGHIWESFWMDASEATPA